MSGMSPSLTRVFPERTSSVPDTEFKDQTSERRCRFSPLPGATLPRKHAGELALIRTVAGLRLFVDGSAPTTASFGLSLLTRKARHALRKHCHQPLPRQFLI